MSLSYSGNRTYQLGVVAGDTRWEGAGQTPPWGALHRPVQQAGGALGREKERGEGRVSASNAADKLDSCTKRYQI